MLDLDMLDFTKGGGYVTVVCQDATSRAVLMVARADREALDRTVATGEMHYHSRSRGLWHKGATSGNVQRVVQLLADCDGDAVLALVHPAGPACHSGALSCFEQGVGAESVGAPPQQQNASPNPTPLHHSISPPTIRTPDSTSIPTASPDTTFATLAATIAQRASALPLPEGAKPSYTQRLLTDRNLRLKKLGEESAELAVACADADRTRAAEEAGDLFYHALVALAAIGVSLEDVTRILDARTS